jgi:lysyl-tRNA synthetase class 2
MLVLGLADSHKQTYRDAFIHEIDRDPHLAGTEELQMLALKYGWESNSGNRDELLDFLFSMKVCPQLGLESPVFVYDYPECQAALATIKTTGMPVAERFELFISGMEIANGFNELCNAKEQYHRFEREQDLRKHTGKAMAPVDELFLTALEHGLPACAGVAVGIDRLLMALTGTKNIENVLTFPDNRN